MEVPEVPEVLIRRNSGAIRAQKNKIRYKSGEKFELPDDFDLDEYTRHSFKVMQDELYTVKVRITPAWARYIGEKIWHESQQTEKLADGSLELTFQVAGLEEIKRWIMGLGPEANVVEPEMLKDMVKADLRKTLIQYERIRPVYHDIAAIKNRPGFMSS